MAFDVKSDLQRATPQHVGSVAVCVGIAIVQRRASTVRLGSKLIHTHTQRDRSGRTEASIPAVWISIEDGQERRVGGRG